MPHFVNLKNAKEVTKLLEHENHKMEERLKELKTAMEREKEERERQGGRHWQRGQTGSLSSYASEILNERSAKKNHTIKKKNIKVLKDEPLDMPSHDSTPESMKHIAQQKIGQESRAKNTRCGQCEEQSASLTCVQCSENYCAGCFASFHLKGALKRHRSVSVHASGPRHCKTPQPLSQDQTRDSGISGGEATSGDVFQLGPCDASGFLESDQDAASKPLLHGAYNEEDSAAHFQEALMAWRRGEKICTSNNNTSSQQIQAQSTVRLPVSTIESSTSTVNNKRLIPEVKSTTYSLSYAQRLLLKQHRRTELKNPYILQLPCKNNTDNKNDLLCLNDERIDFQSLLQAVSDSCQSSNGIPFSKTSLTVTNGIDFPKYHHPANEEFVLYTVEEDIGAQAWESKVESSTKRSQEDDLPYINPAEKSFAKDAGHVLEQLLPEKCNETDSQGSEMPYSKRNGSYTSSRNKNDMTSSVSQTESNKICSTPKAKNGHCLQGFHTHARMTPRNITNGILTKSPSFELKEVARRIQTTGTKFESPLEGFFLVLVKHEATDSTPHCTPAIMPQPKSVKISNKLYSLSPRSWHPSSSLGFADVRENLQQTSSGTKSPLLHFTYSGHLEGKPLSLSQDKGSLNKTPPVLEPKLLGITKDNETFCAIDSFSKTSRKRHRGHSLNTASCLISTLRPSSCISSSPKRHHKPQRPSSSNGVMESTKKEEHHILAIQRSIDDQVQQPSVFHQKNHTNGWTASYDFQNQMEEKTDSQTKNQFSLQNASDTADSSHWETQVLDFMSGSEVSASQCNSPETCQLTPRLSRPQSRAQKETGRISQAVAMDGEDLSKYDDDGIHDRFTQNADDMETLDGLEWELASETGQITGEKISRLSLHDRDDHDISSYHSISSSLHMSYDQAYDINTKLQDNQFLDIDEELDLNSASLEEEEVRALY
ncbi:uncharacterized protein LOC112555265 isoform X2 [Pomacea canaliculata]|uniref:uncharacterized protein LOC112555265 isoform X2 n=1 Tax=Pomacea canaliculata TaxID=400727 RepID=UPI000D732D46|nr:uncharacterized protein LOC112555265 isoform X2 [Pomacea canaliculata]